MNNEGARAIWAEAYINFAGVGHQRQCVSLLLRRHRHQARNHYRRTLGIIAAHRPYLYAITVAVWTGFHGAPPCGYLRKLVSLRGYPSAGAIPG